MHDSPFLPHIQKPEKVLPKAGKPVLLVVFIVIIFVLAGTSFFLAWIHFSDKVIDSSTSLIAEVESLVDLPKGEEPSIATVTDPASLQKQEFFKEARVGDKVLIFSKSRKAILYRPSEGKIIAISPII